MIVREKYSCLHQLARSTNVRPNKGQGHERTIRFGVLNTSPIPAWQRQVLDIKVSLQTILCLLSTILAGGLPDDQAGHRGTTKRFGAVASRRLADKYKRNANVLESPNTLPRVASGMGCTDLER